MARSGNRSGKQGELRIIGGSWRGRKLSFTPADGLRPTSDRIRETLFNWLATSVRGARCADLFAGSGALGLEALSRGAAHCDFVDTSHVALTQIADHLTTLDADKLGRCHPQTARQFLNSTSTPYDIVFVDPPFNQQLVEPVCALLAQRRLLPGALIYVEMAAQETMPIVPAQWHLYRDKTSGGVAYRLYSISEKGIQH
jgi:16S rRNA (guanine966-N2)-methyltransferase